MQSEENVSLLTWLEFQLCRCGNEGVLQMKLQNSKSYFTGFYSQEATAADFLSIHIQINE